MNSDADPFERTDEPVYHVTLWPNRSLNAVGFLSPEERLTLKAEIDGALRGLDINA